MKILRGIKNDQGKEAFAYLAVILLTITSFYVSYQLSTERQWDREKRNDALIFDMRTDLDATINLVKLDLISLHDKLLIDAEKEVLENPSSTRIDHILEGMLIDRLELEFDEWISSLAPNEDNFEISLTNWSVNSQPITGTMEIPVPSTDISDRKSGIPFISNGTVVIGINTTIHFYLVVDNNDNGLHLEKETTIKVQRNFLTDILSRRMDRLQNSIQDGEIVSLMEYIIGSLAQMKCTMGYGRSPGEGEIVPLSLLSDEEILTSLDLALLLLSQAYLRTTDHTLLSTIDEGFGSAPGAGGSIPLGEIMMNASSPVDPSMIPLIGEGLFHEDNPPSLEEMLRPMFYSIVDLIVNRLVSYAGLDRAILLQAGGLKAVFDLGVEAANSLSSSLVGKNIIDAGQETAFSMFEGMLEKSIFLDPKEDNIFVRSKNGLIWNGSMIDGYPEILIPDMQRTYEVGLSDGKNEDIFYRAPNGTIHPISDYYDQTEEFYGVRCKTYSVTANYSFSSIEPPFSSRNLLDDPEFISSLALFLGAESGDGEDEIGRELMEKGRYAVRKVTDHLFDDLTSVGNEDWERMWVGWNTTTHPLLDSGLPPIGTMVNFQFQPIVELAGSFASSLVRELNALDFITTLSGYEEEYRKLISSWISINYDRWIDRDEQMESCKENRTEILFGNCSVSDLEITFLEEEIVSSYNYIYCGKENITFINDHPKVSKWFGLGLAASLNIDSGILSEWSKGIIGSYSEIRLREFNDGTNGKQVGWIRNELNGPSHRGIGLAFSSFKGNFKDISDEVEDLLNRGLYHVERFFERDLNLTGGRFLVPQPPPSKEIVKIQNSDPEHSEIILDHEVKLTRNPGFVVSIPPVEGTYNTDLMNGTPPYLTRYKVFLKGAISVDYFLSAEENFLNGVSRKPMDIEITFPIQVRSNWKMFGVEYKNIGTIWEHALDSAREARDTLKKELNSLVEDLLGDSMSSLREVPPIILDIVKGKDLDLFEIARVFSNITLDLSSTLRETVKGMVTSIMEMGVRRILTTTCNILGIDEIELTLEIGVFSLKLNSERKALEGGEGNLLSLSLDIFPIGMNCFMSFNRIENGSYYFNGTVTFDIGPLFLKMELDPFMMRAPHMISIGVKLEIIGRKALRASFDIPALDEFKCCQVSIGDTLGVEPFIPIPPLGIQAVIDAGFRIRYRMPDELGPHINEVNIFSRNITDIEIYNPRGYALFGSTLEIEDPEEGLIASWRLETASEMFMVVGINITNLWKWKGSLPTDGIVKVVLRSASGIVLDDIVACLDQSGWLSRDADGFGVWRYGDGNPGSQNGGSLPTSLKTLLISIALSSIKEAWTVTYQTYGMTFDMIVPFLEMAIDLFMERFMFVVKELVIDVRMFLSLEVEDASGTAGGGLELSFQADGEAVAEFLGWLYDNIKIFIRNLADPQSAGNYRTFPWEILSRCYIGLDIFMEMEMPGPITKMAPEGSNIPDSFMLAITTKVNLAVPLKLMGRDVGGGYISLGVYIMDAPDAIVSLFYDIKNIGLQQDFYLMKAAIWEESIEMVG